MRAKANLILALVLISATPLKAEEVGDACRRLATSDPDYIAAQLKAYSPDVFGKPTIEWSRDDFVNLSANIYACDGQPKDAQNEPRVKASLWVNPLNMAANDILPINSLNITIQEAYRPHWSWSPVPTCQSILDWKRDAVWNVNNSEELFGRDFKELTRENAVILKGFVGECIPVAKQILELNRMKSAAVDKIENDIYRSLDKEQEASKEDAEALAPSLRVYHEGKRLPLAYLGPQSRKWVDLVNKFELNGTTMRIEDMVTVSKWTEMVLADKKETPESLFAEAVRSIISRRMFSQKK